MKLFNFDKGKTGEKLATDFLKKSGYKIIKTNFSTNIGEIDIIAIKDRILTFVEVKARLNDDYGKPYEAVNNKKIKKIRDTAKLYLLSNKNSYDGISFDIIEVYLANNGINHIVSAFWYDTSLWKNRLLFSNDYCIIEMITKYKLYID